MNGAGFEHELGIVYLKIVLVDERLVSYVRHAIELRITGELITRFRYTLLFNPFVFHKYRAFD